MSSSSEDVTVATDPAPTSPAAMVLPFLRLLSISGVALSVIGHGGRRVTVATSDEVSLRIEELQFDLGEGPAFEVMATGKPQQIEPKLAGGAATPFFHSAVQDLDLATIISLPLRLGAIVIGVVTLYRRQAGLLSTADMTTAAALVHWVAGAAIERATLSAERDSSSAGEPIEELRREVHQATGMILVQLDTTATDAFVQLKAHAFARERTVQSVAQDVITRQLNFANLKNE